MQYGRKWHMMTEIRSDSKRITFYVAYQPGQLDQSAIVLRAKLFFYSVGSTLKKENLTFHEIGGFCCNCEFQTLFTTIEPIYSTTVTNQIACEAALSSVSRNISQSLVLRTDPNQPGVENEVHLLSLDNDDRNDNIPSLQRDGFTSTCL
jgi:hypothetical protein